MRKVKFALIGCGNIGKRHVAVLDADPNAEIVGICDIDENQITTMHNTYSSIGSIWVDYLSMLESIDADIIIIATPHDLHYEMTVAACNAGKNVLVEKPMALSMVESDLMIKAAEENNVKLWVVKQNRFNVPIKLVDELMFEDKLGKIFFVECNVLWNRNNEYYSESKWRGTKREGGALFTQVSHFIDLLIHWFGDYNEVSSIIKTQNHDIDIEDCGVGHIIFDNDVMCSVNWTTNVYGGNYEGSITIIGEKGTIKIGGKYLNKIEYSNIENYTLPNDIEFIDKPNDYDHYKGSSSNHDKVIADIINDFRGENNSTVYGGEGKKSIQLIEKIYENK
jgi:predicted dehydrogenase